MDLPEQKKKERYNRLLHRHLRRINTICTFEARSYEDGRDLVQEVMVALWEGLENLQSDASLWQEAAWVRRVMVRTAIDHGRRRLSHRRNGRAVPLDHLSGTRQEGGDDGLFDGSIELRVHDREDTKSIMDELKKIEGIQEVTQIM